MHLIHLLLAWVSAHMVVATILIGVGTWFQILAIRRRHALFLDIEDELLEHGHSRLNFWRAIIVVLGIVVVALAGAYLVVLWHLPRIFS